MKICIVHGSPRKGNTYMATTIFKRALERHENITFTEFFLPADMPHFCKGCFICFEKGEDRCPHAQYVQPIAKAIREADGIILTSPVYVMAETGQMKTLLDHFGYIYIPHRPMEEMFSKVAIVISTTAGAGTSHAIEPIVRNLNYWGVPRVYKCGFTLHSKNWEDMKLEKRQMFENILGKKANQFYKSLQNRNNLTTPIFTKVIFRIMKSTIPKYGNGNIDMDYWKQKGWIGGKKRPF